LGSKRGNRSLREAPPQRYKKNEGEGTTEKREKARDLRRKALKGEREARRRSSRKKPGLKGENQDEGRDIGKVLLKRSKPGGRRGGRMGGDAPTLQQSGWELREGDAGLLKEGESAHESTAYGRMSVKQ